MKAFRSSPLPSPLGPFESASALQAFVFLCRAPA